MPLIAAFDVHYTGDGRATAAAVLFGGYAAAEAASQCVLSLPAEAAYIPGEFYRRELPCILALLGRIDPAPAAMIVDGYVQLGSRPGLGRHLWDALDGRIPVIGVAKSRFAGAPAAEVFRGGSRRPLYVTCMGVDRAAAAENIRTMHGAHRIPTLLKQVDALARTAWKNG